METWSEECAIKAAMIHTRSCHQREAVMQVKGVLRIGAGRCLTLGRAHTATLLRSCQSIILAKIVVVNAQSCREVMIFAHVGFIYQQAIYVLLVHAIRLKAILRILLVHGSRTHQGDVCATLGVQYKGMLHVSLIAFGVYTYLIHRLSIGHHHAVVLSLSAPAALIEQ